MPSRLGLLLSRGSISNRGFLLFKFGVEVNSTSEGEEVKFSFNSTTRIEIRLSLE